MFDNLHFYNHYGNGDIFISKEFVREIKFHAHAANYYYAHAKNKRILGDLPLLEWEPITDNHQMRKYSYVLDNDFYCNTWMGVTSKYVPTNSCTIYNAYRMYNDILWQAGLPRLLKAPLEYLPSIDYSCYQVKNVDKFVQGVDEFILFDNCYVQSNQAKNFDFTPIIDDLSQTYSDKIFVTTMKVDLGRSNILHTADITKTDDGFDLNEISYLSKFTKLIIGRSSGPEVFCMTKDNCFDPNKTFLSFTYKREAAHIVDWNLQIPATRVWSDAVEIDDVYRDICTIMERIYP